MTHSHPTGAATVEVKCQRCKQPFMARVADRARGWGKFCSKSCKAIKQTQVTGWAGPGSGPRPGHMGDHDCSTCGEAAINGVRTPTGIEWYCARHEYEAHLHPFDSEALGQW